MVRIARDRKLHEVVCAFRDRLEDRRSFGADRESVHGVFHINAGIYRTVAAQKRSANREFRIRDVCVLPRLICQFQQLFVIDQNRITNPMFPDSLPLLIVHQPELSLSGNINAPCKINRKNGGPISN